MTELSKPEAALASIFDILNHDRGSTDDCNCSECLKIQADAEVAGIFCDYCGFKGTFATMECACYDSHCSPSARGAGCFHGGLVCPICDDGERQTELLQQIRAALIGIQDPSAGRGEPDLAP